MIAILGFVYSAIFQGFDPMGLITIFHHHLGESFWVTFSKLRNQIPEFWFLSETKVRTFGIEERVGTCSTGCGKSHHGFLGIHFEVISPLAATHP